MCDSEGELFKTSVEGAVMSVCKSCSKFGKVLSKVVVSKSPKMPVKEAPVRNEIISVVVPDYSKLIKTSRERTGLTQDELANKLGEKSSMKKKPRFRKIKVPA